MLITGQIIQELLSLYDQPSYLEIGVFKGETFLPMRAARKVGVDPHFRFDVEAARAGQPNAQFHTLSSDDYFGRVIDPAERFDVIFLDGLHTFGQTLRDFNNAIFHLQPNGVVLIDDVMPTSWAASLETQARAYAIKDVLGARDGGNWMGDVYKLVFFLDAFFQQFTFRTVMENHGQLIGWRERRPQVRERTVEAVSRVTFADVIEQKDVYAVTPFETVRAQVAQMVRR